ncbi:hypothetical protein Btru_011327 [Bulinus truncatus]|nr:hypothetical protein Btru_011327 [Bulinus truncatus]
MIVQVDTYGSSNLVFKLAGMQEEGKFCDFSIFVSGYEIKAHKCVLAACCEYFQTSFNFPCTSKCLKKTDLTHVGCDPKYVEMVIRSFYTNEIDLELSCLESVLKLVDYLMCDILRRCVEMYMVNTLNFHTAITYFQLSLQYNLDSVKLFTYTKWLLWYRFHDYFIYHSDLNSSSVEVIESLLVSGIFHDCNPLQVIELFLNNMQNTLRRLLDINPSKNLMKGLRYQFDAIFHIWMDWFRLLSTGSMDRWKMFMLDFLRSWKKKNVSDHSYKYNCLVRWLETVLQGFLDPETEALECSKGRGCGICFHDINCKRLICVGRLQNEKSTTNSEFQPGHLVGAQLRNIINSNKLEIEALATSNKSSEAHQETVSDCENVPQHPFLQSEKKDMLISNGELKTPEEDSASCSQSAACFRQSPQQTSTALVPAELLPLDSRNDRPSNIIVVLAPSGAMASQIMAIEAEKGNTRPLLKSPQLELALYDIEMKTWREGCRIDFPISGVMLEKHAWRMAFLNDCLYLFSANKGTALEFSLANRQWAHLDGKQLFSRHGKNSPVKSVIPIAVGSRLIVLSMSREMKADGTFQTLQHFYEMDLSTKTFNLAASVKDDHLDQPITKWSVNENILITVKASSMMHRKFISVQYIHVYNAETRSLQILEVDCATESGVRLLMKGNVLYLLDKEGWCKAYDLDKSEWLPLNKHPSDKPTGSLYTVYADDVYPALTRVSCQAGSSRWEITTSKTVVNSCLKETYIDDENQIKICFHPSPPFQFMTAMCPGQMSRADLDKLPMPLFNFVDNRMLNFTLSNSMDPGNSD